jgi:hypothetical protein
MNPITSVIELVKCALKALTAFLELRRETYFFEASTKHLDYKESVRNEITKLRNQGTTAATDRADLLMLSLKERERAWERASATYFSYTGGNKNLN